MVILNLPDEPNTPAGKAIKTAMAPSAEQLAAKVIPNKFQLVFNSNPNLGDCVLELWLDLAENELTFIATENGRFEWMDWILKSPKSEVVTLFFLDDNNKHRCVLIMNGVSVFTHTCFMSNEEDLYNVQVEPLEHKVTMKFTEIERVDPEGLDDES